jgi:phage gp16-like protein
VNPIPNQINGRPSPDQWELNRLAELRRARMGAIGAMQKQLGMDEDTLRCLFVEVTGKRSRSKMNLEELTKVRDRLVAAGGKLTPPGGGRRIAIDDMAGKLRALWLRGHQLGIIGNPSEQALCSWASNSRAETVTALLQSFGPDEYTAVIERLKKWLKREIGRGHLVCAEGHRRTVSGPKLTSAIIWHTPILCVDCTRGGHEQLMAWRKPAGEQET